VQLAGKCDVFLNFSNPKFLCGWSLGLGVIDAEFLNSLSWEFLLLLTLNLFCDYFVQGWTVFEILKYAPLHNWKAYEEVLKSNPVLAKMMISGVVYSIGDWIGQVRRNAFHVVVLDNLDTFL